MKIVMVCGSPRPTGGTSMYLLNALKEKLENGNDICICHLQNQSAVDPLMGEIAGSGALVFAFPLYVDSVPSNLLEALSAMEKKKLTGTENTKVYLVVNNGFYDAAQNGVAIDMLWNWCVKCGLQKGYAIGVGAGEMSQAAPLGHGPSANLGRAMDQLAEDIRQRRSGKTVFVEPNFPRFLYLAAGHMMWKKKAKANGLKLSDIRRS